MKFNLRVLAEDFPVGIGGFYLLGDRNGVFRRMEAFAEAEIFDPGYIGKTKKSQVYNMKTVDKRSGL